MNWGYTDGKSCKYKFNTIHGGNSFLVIVIATGPDDKGLYLDMLLYER